MYMYLEPDSKLIPIKGNSFNVLSFTTSIFFKNLSLSHVRNGT